MAVCVCVSSESEISCKREQKSYFREVDKVPLVERKRSNCESYGKIKRNVLTCADYNVVMCIKHLRTRCRPAFYPAQNFIFQWGGGEITLRYHIVSTKIKLYHSCIPIMFMFEEFVSCSRSYLADCFRI